MNIEQVNATLPPFFLIVYVLGSQEAYLQGGVWGVTPWANLSQILYRPYGAHPFELELILTYCNFFDDFTYLVTVCTLFHPTECCFYCKAL